MFQRPPFACPQCGTPVNTGHYFCPNCGAGISPPIPPPPTPTVYNVPSYTTPTIKKRRSPWVGVIITIAVIVLIAGSIGIFALINNIKNISVNMNNGNTATTNTTSKNINVTVTYASDEITFTNIKQATKFDDDSMTQYNYSGTKNYIRLSFNEKQMSTSNAYFSYTSAFRLKFPNGTAVNGIKAGELIGPEQGVQRPNWIDYPAANGTVDLATLSIILGTADEAQMTIPLKNNADVSQYQLKQYTLNSPCKYAGMNVTVQSATISYYYNGKQAKSSKRFLSIQILMDNNQDASVYLSPHDFLRLKTSDSVIPPEYSSDLNNFYVISPNTTGITGTAIFNVTPSSDGKYTLIFQKGNTINEVDLPMQFS